MQEIEFDKKGVQHPMTTLEAIKNRRSIRKFKSDGVVTDEQIKTLLEAAMLAPSACNTRPWEFIVVKDRAKMNEIRKHHPYTGMLETAWALSMWWR